MQIFLSNKVFCTDHHTFELSISLVGFIDGLGVVVPDSNVVVILTSSAENPRADCELECWLGPPDTAPKKCSIVPR